MHLLIPFAGSSAPDCQQALRSLELPHLGKLLRRLSLADTDAGGVDSLTPPHERVLARRLGMEAPDGCIAWAAHEMSQSGRDPGDSAWGWITPAHWDVGPDRIVMADPDLLKLEEAESRTLLAAMQPFFVQDGITLLYCAPQRWLARGAVFEQLASASLDRVVGREISAWMPSLPKLRRLQNEMQMLLYTHPLSDARTARGAPAVNSFWVSGTGRLPATAHTAPTDGLVVADGLRQPAQLGDWAAWARSWSEIDQRECRALLGSLGTAAGAQLTLATEGTALGFSAPTGGLVQRLRQRFAPATLQLLWDLA